MKKLIITFLVMAMSYGAYANADSQHAIGLRVGYGVQVDYQYRLSERNRIELSGGLTHWRGGFGVTGNYHWTWDIKAVPGLSWYVGPGLYLGWMEGFALGLTGQVGLQYDFKKIPLSLSVDYRPMVAGVTLRGENAYFTYRAYDFGLSVRYRL